MGHERFCDLCKSKIQIMDFDPADHHSTGHFSLMGPTSGLLRFDCCLDCIKDIVRTIGGRYPSATRKFVVQTKEFLRDITELEEKDAAWRVQNPNTEED